MIKFSVEKIDDLIRKEELPKAILSFGMERKRELENIKNHDKMMESVAATILMNKLLTDAGYAADDIIKDNNGAPKLMNQKDIYCSISHSKEYVACGISSSPIGVDIQKMKIVDQKNFSKRFFNEEEVRYLEKIKKNPLEIFYQIWTSKESYLKMMRIGLQKELKSFKTDLKKNVIFDLNGNIIGKVYYKIYEDYMFCICSSNGFL